VEVFCDVDDFSAVCISEWEKTLLTDGTRKCTGRMTMSEIMTTITLSELVQINQTRFRGFGFNKTYLTLNQLA
jgi:hypothetical protein